MMDKPRMRTVAFFGLCLGVLSLSGCVGAFDPFQRPYQWSATGASNETIAQQAANKGDLIKGQSEPGANGVAAVGGLQKALSGGSAAGLQSAVSAPSTGGGS
jgi:hypothetical protein